MKPHFLTSILACAGLILLESGSAVAAPAFTTPNVFAPNSQPFGHSYAEWAASSWQWGLGLPACCPYPGNHPFGDSPGYDVTEGQAGNVWFLAGVFGTVERTCAIPAGKSLFLQIIDVEASSLEDAPFGSPTEAGQTAIANDFANHILVGSLFCTVDGMPVTGLGDYRIQSPQFSFTAPTPWIFGGVGGTGTSVSDGYYVFLQELPAGQHVIHIGGAFDEFAGGGAIDTTYNLTVGGEYLPPSSYCTAKVNSQGCLPSTGWTGTPSLSGPDNFHVTASLVRNSSVGIMFWGTTQAALPFAGGTRCIQGPLIRSGHMSSGGNPYPAHDCSGAYDFYFSHDYMAGYFLGAGTTVYAQFWQRDPGHPDGTGQGLTDGLRFTITP